MAWSQKFRLTPGPNFFKRENPVPVQTPATIGAIEIQQHSNSKFIKTMHIPATVEN